MNREGKQVSRYGGPWQSPADRSPDPNSFSATVDSRSLPRRPARPMYSSPVKWCIAIALLAAVLWRIPARDIAASLHRVLIGPLVGAIAVMATSRLLQGLRLWLFARPLGLSWGLPQLFAIQLASMAYQLVLPAGNLAGAAVRLYKFSRGQQNVAAAGVMLLADRLVATMTLGTIGIICFFAAGDGSSGWLAVAFAAIVVACAAGLIGINSIAAHSDAPGGMERSLAAKATHAVRAFLATAGGRLIRQQLFGRLIARFKPTNRVPAGICASAVVLSLLIQMLGIVIFLAVGRSIGITLGFWEIGLVRAAMLAATLLPVTVAGLGLREGAAVLMLSHMGQGGGTAVTFSLLIFAVSWVLPGLAGAAIELVSARRRK